MPLLASVLQTLAREFRAVTKTDKTHQEEADVTYAGGFPEDYSDVFGAPAAALPAF